jgi:hypothetical protein
MPYSDITPNDTEGSVTVATMLELLHQGAGHPGTLADCAKCAAHDPNRAEVKRRARAAARRRSAALTKRLDQHR